MIKQRMIYIAVFLFMIFIFSVPFASAEGTEVKVNPALHSIDRMLIALQENHMKQADQSFEKYKYWWRQHKGEIRKDSYEAYGKIERQMGIISIALLNHQISKIEVHLGQLKTLFRQYQSGAFEKTRKSDSKDSLPTYLQKLKKTRILLENHQWAQAEQTIQILQKQWLSVEGNVVSQSQQVYTESEKNLVLMAAYISNPNQRDKTIDLVDQMIFSLKPLANANYGLWDAALIPIREGLEALLVIGALLTFAKKAGSAKAKRWIWGGSLSAMGVCLAVGFIVSYMLSTTAFGHNNTLINGWAGVMASVMLLYVSHWLHRHSNVHRWNHFIRSKSEKAMTNGRMLSFSILAFLAILREGMETVIFLIGMVGRMSAIQLMSGIVIGCAVLAVIGFIMLKIGVKLPMKPFFLISSIIVFYLCLKFMGSGIHSLQMSGVLPTIVRDDLPSISWLSIYPSWVSLLPQMVFLAAALFIVIKNQYQKYKPSPKQAKEAV